MLHSLLTVYLISNSSTIYFVSLGERAKSGHGYLETLKGVKEAWVLIHKKIGLPL
jgi:hypothetical protein